jgi:hypothetical protein
MKNLILTILSILTPLWTVYGQNNCRQVASANTEGLLVITRPSNGVSKIGFVDLNGKVRIEPKYDEAYQFSDGRALVLLNEKYGYINPKGEEVIKPQFYEACSFSEGLAAVKIDGKYGFIDTKGDVKIPPQFELAFNFSDGLARIRAKVKVNVQGTDIYEELYGYIDKTGKPVITPNFTMAKDFRDGIAEVVDPTFGLETYINREGKIISRKSNSPSKEGLGFDYASLIKIKIESIPDGANIYLIPIRRLEIDPTLTSKSEDELYEFKVPSGATPTEFLAKRKVYTVLLVLGGTRKWVNLDVRPDGTNNVKLSLR